MALDTAPARPVRVERLDDGAIWRVTLAKGKGNVIDRALVDALAGVVDAVAAVSGAKAVVLDAEGDHFSYGASVEEHLPDVVGVLLDRFHGLLRAMLGASIPFLAAVRGRCLGGGLELASFCHRVVAHPGARFSQPEISLGVFAPAASAFLAERIGRPAAEDLLLTGREVTAEEARGLGLVDEVADDPTAAALAWARRHLLPKSASSLRHAASAARHGLARRFFADLRDLERIYLEDLMSTHDGVEGLHAFLEKRPPRWTDR